LRLQGNLGLCDFELGRLESARDALVGAVQLARRHGPEQILPVLMVNLAAVHVELADYERGQRCAEEAIAVGTALGDRLHTLVGQLNLSQSLFGQGQFGKRAELVQQALVLGEQCIQALDAAQAPLFAAHARDLQGEIEVSLLHHAEAQAWFQSAQTAFAALGQESARLKALAAVAFTRSQQAEDGSTQQALAVLRPVLDHLAICPADDPVATHLRTTWFCHGVLKTAGHADAPRLLALAQAALRGALGRLQDPVLREQFARRQTFAPAILATLAPPG
jgi:tetratricopeptide (TPR) repeat protein